jgi:hypothetical protein
VRRVQNYLLDFKLDLVAEAMAPGASVCFNPGIAQLRQKTDETKRI